MLKNASLTSISNYLGLGLLVSPNQRVLVQQLLDKDTLYDVKRYTELLVEIYASVLQPFGLNKSELVNIPFIRNF